MSARPRGLPNQALVVRGGRNEPEDLRRGMATHPCGVTGVSVMSAAGVAATELAESLPHGEVGVTTVGVIRAAGGDVLVTAGRSPFHATLTGLSPEVISGLLKPTVRKEALEARRLDR